MFYGRTNRSAVKESWAWRGGEVEYLCVEERDRRFVREVKSLPYTCHGETEEKKLDEEDQEGSAPRGKVATFQKIRGAQPQHLRIWGGNLLGRLEVEGPSENVIAPPYCSGLRQNDAEHYQPLPGGGDGKSELSGSQQESN